MVCLIADMRFGVLYRGARDYAISDVPDIRDRILTPSSIGQQTQYRNYFKNH